MQIKNEFAKDLVAELIKNKPDKASTKVIVSFAKGTIRCIENEENKEGKINQYLAEI